MSKFLENLNKTNLNITGFVIMISARLITIDIYGNLNRGGA